MFRKQDGIMHSPDGTHILHPFSQGSVIISEEGKRENIMPEVVDDYKDTLSSGHSRGSAHRNS